MVKFVDRDLENKLRMKIINDLVEIASLIFADNKIFRMGNLGICVGDKY